MGRYVYGKNNGFEYKFAFGDQSSSFGEVLQRLADGTDTFVERFIGDSGEIVRVHANGCDEFINNLKEFSVVEDLTQDQEELWSRCKLQLGDDYWDKVMVAKLLKEIQLNDILEFEVEY